MVQEILYSIEEQLGNVNGNTLAAREVDYYCMRNTRYEISGYGLIIEASSEVIKHINGSKVPHCKLFYR